MTGKMEHNASAKNKARSNAVTTHSHKKRNIPSGLSLTTIVLYHSISPASLMIEAKKRSVY